MSADPARRRRFEAVAHEVYEPLQRYLRRRAAADVADEVFNDALLVIWRRLDEVPQPVALPWCYGVARRCLANQRRGATRRLRLVERLATQPQPTESDPGGFVDAGEPELAAAIGTLTEAEREIVRLWAWEGLEPREIAMVLETTANAVSVALSRARGKLAERLGRKDATGSGHTRGGRTYRRQEDQT